MRDLILDRQYQNRLSLAEGQAMTSDLDVYRSAKLLIDHHGDEAPIHAAMQADAMLDKGDLDGAAVWRRIVGDINELLSTRPSDGESVH